MKKICLIVFLILVLSFVVVACSGKNAEPTQTATQPSSVSGSAQITASPVPSPSASATAAGNLSPTTGLPGNTEYRPVQVQIDNEPTGRPQYGIQAADIVYEAMIEGLDTRLSCIFNDTLPAKVGPVRSSRVYFQMIQNEWDSIYIHDGGPYVASFPKSYIYSDENGGDMKARVDGSKGVSEDIFWHTSAEFAWTNVQAAEDKYNYTRTQRDPLFQFDSNVDYSKYPAVEKIDIPFISKDITHVEYQYDKANDNFVRYCFGDPFIDAETDEAVTVQNIIVQYASLADLPGEGTATQSPRVVIGMIGSGKAEFFVNGKHMTGTWSKSDKNAGTVYKLDDGSSLVLKPGNTWIEIQPDSKSIVTTNEDGTTYPAKSQD